jgi:hypothetical protein
MREVERVAAGAGWCSGVRRGLVTCPTASRRWWCAGTRCSTPAWRSRARGRTFTEQIPELPAGARLTGRLRRHDAGRVANGLPVSTACGRLMSWPIGHAAWVVHAAAVLPDPAPVSVLGIDETRRGRPVWAQHPDTGTWRLTERFETNFFDLAGTQGLLGQTAGRTSAAVAGEKARTARCVTKRLTASSSSGAAPARRGLPPFGPPAAASGSPPRSSALIVPPPGHSLADPQDQRRVGLPSPVTDRRRSCAHPPRRRAGESQRGQDPAHIPRLRRVSAGPV